MSVFDLPLVFFVTLALVVGLILEALQKRQWSWSRPAIAAYFTIAAWYLGDMAYNGPEQFYAQFTLDEINFAYIQVIFFLLAYRLFILIGSTYFQQDRRPPLPRYSYNQEKAIAITLVAVWAAITSYALIRVEFDIWSILFPPFSLDLQYPWSRGAVGSGGDFLISTLEYIHMAVVGLLGVMVALVRRRSLRMVVTAVYIIALQLYLFQWARNRMLAVMMPGILAYLLLSPSKTWVKVTVGSALFFAISSWFLISVSIRGKEGEILARIEEASRSDGTTTKMHHGLNMFEELCFHNMLMQRNIYNPTPGARYFAEIVAVIPRNVWPDKPFIGIDYAIARGFGGANTAHGVSATIASGTIGQGVQNFGPWFGPPFAAFLMFIWNLILAKLWIQRANFARLGLFLLGMGLTYNMGRDITLLVLFPFLFSYIGVLLVEYFSPKNAGPRSIKTLVRV